MKLQLPNAVSILAGIALVAMLTALAGELPNSAEGWLPLAGAAILGGLAKAVQVWLDARQHADARMMVDNPSKLRQFLVG